MVSPGGASRYHGPRGSADLPRPSPCARPAPVRLFRRVPQA